jgi:protein-disulfide isomerase
MKIGNSHDMQLHPPFSDDDHVRGLRGAATMLVVYGDYECPESARLWRVLSDMRADNAALCEVFRYFPLTRVHPHAFVAATAAEAAGDQKMFWQMHDLLFGHQDTLEPADLVAHAAALGLEVARFEEDVAYGTFADTVRAHQRSGISSGVTTTPAVFVNGRLIDLPDPERVPDLLPDRGGSQPSSERT